MELFWKDADDGTGELCLDGKTPLDDNDNSFLTSFDFSTNGFFHPNESNNCKPVNLFGFRIVGSYFTTGLLYGELIKLN